MQSYVPHSDFKNEVLLSSKPSIMAILQRGPFFSVHFVNDQKNVARVREATSPILNPEITTRHFRSQNYLHNHAYEMELSYGSCTSWDINLVSRKSDCD